VLLPSLLSSIPDYEQQNAAHCSTRHSFRVCFFSTFNARKELQWKWIVRLPSPNYWIYYNFTRSNSQLQLMELQDWQRRHEFLRTAWKPRCACELCEEVQACSLTTLATSAQATSISRTRFSPRPIISPLSTRSETLSSKSTISLQPHPMGLTAAILSKC
jgi:hypothetical protein